MDKCGNGHIFDERNTYTYPKTGRRMCRACHRDAERNRIRSSGENIQKNRDRVRMWCLANPDKAKATRRNWLAQIRATIDAAKATGCANCGESDLACLDFHHKNPSKKDYNIGVALGTISLRKIRVEIAKCIVLCANCHRKLHAAERERKINHAQ